MARLWYAHFDSTPEDRRLLLAEDWARYNRSLVTDGVRNGGSCLEVTAAGGMKVNIGLGIANVQGYIFRLDEDLDGTSYLVTVPDANPSYPRVDRIVLRLNRTIDVRMISIEVKLGTAGANPVPPILQRDALIWELSLARVNISAQKMAILNTDITDERFDTELCGLMNSVLGLDPSTWQTQVDKRIDELSSVWEEAITDASDRVNSKTDNFLNLVGSLETHAFTLINNNFDDISVKTGTTLSTEWLADGRKMETRVINQSGNVLCTRETFWGKEVGVAVKTAIVKFYDNVFVINSNMVRSTNSQYREITRYGRVITKEVL